MSRLPSTCFSARWAWNWTEQWWRRVSSCIGVLFFFRSWECCLQCFHDLVAVNEFHFDNVPALQGALLQACVLHQMHTLQCKNYNFSQCLINHKSDTLIGMLINTNDSTLASPGVEASGFQSSFSNLYSVLEQKVPIYWHFNTFPVSSTCSHTQPLSDRGQQYTSASGVRAQSNYEG